MASVPPLAPEQIAQVSGLVAQYITAQRGKYAPRAVPLSDQQREPLEPYFAGEVLNSWHVRSRGRASSQFARRWVQVKHG
jgi:hypothetical protein